MANKKLDQNELKQITDIQTRMDAVKTELGYKLFLFVFIVWSIYGVAAMMPTPYKNISYNILDIIAKNFYDLTCYNNISYLKSIFLFLFLENLSIFCFNGLNVIP